MYLNFSLPLSGALKLTTMSFFNRFLRTFLDILFSENGSTSGKLEKKQLKCDKIFFMVHNYLDIDQQD